MKFKTNILELNTRNNTWNPPEIQEMKLAYSVRNDVIARQSADFLFIFQTKPYIDSLYIEYDEEREPVNIRRFAVHEGYTWDKESEEFFHNHCVKNQNCAYSGEQIERIYYEYKDLCPEWHIKSYITQGLRLIDHIYNCIKENTAKEMLYKAGLDELAAHIDEIDELNLFARKPSDLYDGLTMKVLRNLNCPDGAKLISTASNRVLIKDLNQKFPDTFSDKLNDAQCRYINTLITGELTVGEVGRLFKSRKKDLSYIWTESMLDTFLTQELHDMKMTELCNGLGSIDKLYEKYIKNTKNIEKDLYITQLEFYLLIHREEYDKKIRRSNRKRDYEWQERGTDYIVRYPQTINDVCREAVYMQNCLITYVEALINNDTTVLFMRKADEPNKPFIDIEIYGETLMQAYHRFNKDCTDDEAVWIMNYCQRHDISLGTFSFGHVVDELY